MFNRMCVAPPETPKSSVRPRDVAADSYSSYEVELSAFATLMAAPPRPPHSVAVAVPPRITIRLLARIGITGFAVIKSTNRGLYARTVCRIVSVSSCKYRRTPGPPRRKHHRIMSGVGDRTNFRLYGSFSSTVHRMSVLGFFTYKRQYGSCSTAFCNRLSVFLLT